MVEPMPTGGLHVGTIIVVPCFDEADRLRCDTFGISPRKPNRSAFFLWMMGARMTPLR